MSLQDQLLEEVVAVIDAAEEDRGASLSDQEKSDLVDQLLGGDTNVENVNPQGINQYSHGDSVRIRPDAIIRKGGADIPHPRAGEVGTVHRDGLSKQAQQEDRDKGRIRLDVGGKIIATSLSHVEPHQANGTSPAPKAATPETFGKPIESKGTTGMSGMLPGVTRVKFHSGEHQGMTGTVEGVIPMRYSKSETTHRIRLDGLKGGLGEVTATTAHLQKHATTVHNNKPSIYTDFVISAVRNRLVRRVLNEITDEADGRWITVRGAHIFVRGDQSASDAIEEHLAKHSGIAKDDKTGPPPGKAYQPDVRHDGNGDGITDAARVGVPAFSVPPPPKIQRLPNLTPHEREAESAFAEEYEKNPDGMASDFREGVHKIAELKAAKSGQPEPPTFGTDDAKELSSAWSHPDLETRLQNRATLNNALHQTANALTKRAFLQELDTLKPGDQVMVTVGGCGAGKGYSLGKVDEAKEMKARSKAVWDSAGDQNATENPWIQQEAEKRGLHVNYLYVHADPHQRWADKDSGVVQRATKPDDGRMVDAKVFADSYDIGAKNHQSFYEQNKDNPNCTFVFVDGTTKPKPTKVPSIPKEAFNINAEKLAKYASKVVKTADVPARIKLGALGHERIWPNG